MSSFFKPVYNQSTKASHLYITEPLKHFICTFTFLFFAMCFFFVCLFAATTATTAAGSGASAGAAKF